MVTCVWVFLISVRVQQPLSLLPLTAWFSVPAIIAKEDTSLEEEIKEIRQSGSNKDLASPPEFEMSDIFYFARRGVESIMDDEVTKRFSAEELESWNLLTRSNNNFHYISLRLTVLWGLGVLIRYGFLLPLRYQLQRSNINLVETLGWKWNFRMRWSGWRGGSIPCVKALHSGGSWRLVSGLDAGLLMSHWWLTSWINPVWPFRPSLLLLVLAFTHPLKWSLFFLLTLRIPPPQRLMPTQSNLHLLHPWTMSLPRLGVPVGCQTPFL